MSRPKPDLQARKAQILSSAEKCIILQGYEKTTFEDIADETGLSRASIYLCYRNKEDLFTAILLKEMHAYLEDLVLTLQNDPDCDSVSGAFSAVMRVVGRSPLLTALLKGDRHIFGRFLTQHPEMMNGVDATQLWIHLLTQMRSASLISDEVDIPAFASLMSATALGIMLQAPASGGSTGMTPDLDALLGTFARMLEAALPKPQAAPPGAMRHLILETVLATRQQFTQMPLKE